MTDIDEKDGLDYVRSAFVIVERDLPVTDGRVDMILALNMCIHWTALGVIPSLLEWMEVRNPADPHRWPANTKFPG